MSILIYNCFHWIGYHLTNELLQKGYQVEGFHENMSEQACFLSMFFGRNENFKEINEKKSEYDQVFYIHKKNQITFLPYEDVIYLTEDETSQKSFPKSSKVIPLPLLFGEWMEMDDQGVYHLDEYISFQSDRFKNRAIYVLDFVDILLKILNENNDHRNEELKDLLLDSLNKIRNNRPIEDKIQKLLTHYKAYQSFYK